jgi:hypothetical protein
MMLYDPTPDPGEPDMEVRLGTEWRLPNGAILPVDGTPIVLCDLNRAQSEWAIANGMPDSLVDELVKAATAVGWPTGSAQPVVVDAGPHFPALATDNTKTSRPALGNGGFPASPFRSARWGHSSIKLDRITALVYAIVLALSAPPLFVGLARLRRAGPGHRSRPSCGRCGRMIDGAMDGAAACPACNAALAEAGIWPPDRSRGSLVFAGLLWLGLALLLWAGMWALSERTPGAIAARERKLLSDPEVRRFVERFGDPQKEGLDLFLGPMSFTTPSGQAILWQGSGVYRILPDEEKLMGVMFHPRPPPGCPRMELYVELLHRTPQGALAKTRGMSPILCYLSDAQVEHAMEHGLPESLVQKLLETAAQTAAATGPGSTLPGTPTIVPADEHFPVR